MILQEKSTEQDYLKYFEDIDKEFIIKLLYKIDLELAKRDKVIENEIRKKIGYPTLK